MDYSFQGRHPPSQLTEMATSFNPSPDSTWYADSGATNHIAHDLNNLSIHASYHVKDKVSIGNGQGLHITNIDSSVVDTLVSSFQLNNILNVPAISTNLLSVHQFTKVNNCLFYLWF